MRRALVKLITLAASFALVVASPLAAQERFSFFLASTPESVERLLQLANLQDDDVVVDLGSGDGLIPRTAARMNPKLRGWGVDINASLVDQANRLAREEGVGDRVRFHQRNAFDADLRDATVITMWLFPELMQLLRPIILERARPGTRVLTSTWNLGSWPPDEVSTDYPQIFKWIVPARVAGTWRWDLQLGGRRVRYASVKEQVFQKVEGVARAADRREVLEDVALRGADLTFTLRITIDGLGLTTHVFRGTVEDNRITGTVEVRPTTGTALTLPWRAERVSRSDYFAHTGLDLFQAPGTPTP
jgi:hypothetical protein